MNAAILLSELDRRGIQLSIEGDGIRVRPFSALTDSDREAIRENKAVLLHLLQVTEVASTPQPSPEDGLIHVGPWIMLTTATMEAYRAHWDRKQAQ